MFETPTPEPARVQLWIARPAAIDDPALLARYNAVLSADENAWLGRRQRDAAKVYLVTRALVRWALSRSTDVAPDAWEFGENDFGKPHVVGPPGAPRPFFNVSHSGELVVCAVTSSASIGVDVEDLEHERRFAQVAKRFFAPCEAEGVCERSGAEQREQFYRYWTLKEAYIKARGLGISVPLSAFWFDLESGAELRISFDDRIEDDPRAWKFWQQRVDDHHLAALALEGGEDARLEVETREITPTL